MTIDKAQLMTVIERMLDVMRHLLASIRQEQRAVCDHQIEKSHHIMEERFTLFHAFEKRNQEFDLCLHDLGISIDFKDVNLEEKLEVLIAALEDDDLNLKLKCEQLLSHLNELQSLCTSTVSHLQLKPHPPSSAMGYAVGLKPAVARAQTAVIDLSDANESE